MKPKYNIGDEVWWATSGSRQVWETCPDCGGTKYIRLIMFDNTEHQIECKNCGPGYNPPCGRVSFYEYQAETKKGTISGVEINYKGEVEYKLKKGDNSCYCVLESDLFSTEQEAETHAQELVKKHNEEERNRIFKKEKDTRTWAYNVSYHRRCIKDAEKNLVYHTAKLNAAKAHVKEEKSLDEGL
jgi:predicted RNA-binding Zn-ribbon protein involved in translation (DUF1610 family)